MDGVFLYHAASTWAYTPEFCFGVLFLNRLYRFRKYRNVKYFETS